MPNWLKKALVTCITIFTFGLVTPPSALLENAKAHKSSKPDVEQASSADIGQASEVFYDEQSEESVTPAIFVTYAMEEAERQSVMKFGTKIAPVIEDEFKEVILPRIEETLSAFAGTIPSDSLQHLALSQKPAGGEYEKIFHVYDERTGKDLLRFHVRRDRPPLEGYYFNFHYHSVEDEYATHYNLGNMYWGKNKPPQWLS